uniref:GYF domain-containing protein n=1 Tax=Trichuris muris TaxID=70415 RepID=A0A5S6Q6P3_TRIMR
MEPKKDEIPSSQTLSTAELLVSAEADSTKRYSKEYFMSLRDISFWNSSEIIDSCNKYFRKVDVDGKANSVKPKVTFAPPLAQKQAFLRPMGNFGHYGNRYRPQGPLPAANWQDGCRGSGCRIYREAAPRQAYNCPKTFNARSTASGGSQETVPEDAKPPAVAKDARRQNKEDQNVSAAHSLKKSVEPFSPELLIPFVEKGLIVPPAVNPPSDDLPAHTMNNVVTRSLGEPYSYEKGEAAANTCDVQLSDTSASRSTLSAKGDVIPQRRRPRCFSAGLLSSVPECVDGTDGFSRSVEVPDLSASGVHKSPNTQSAVVTKEDFSSGASFQPKRHIPLDPSPYSFNGQRSRSGRFLPRTDYRICESQPSETGRHMNNNISREPSADWKGQKQATMFQPTSQENCVRSQVPISCAMSFPDGNDPPVYVCKPQPRDSGVRFISARQFVMQHLAKFPPAVQNLKLDSDQFTKGKAAAPRQSACQYADGHSLSQSQLYQKSGFDTPTNDSVQQSDETTTSEELSSAVTDSFSSAETKAVSLDSLGKEATHTVETSEGIGLELEEIRSAESVSSMDENDLISKGDDVVEEESVEKADYWFFRKGKSVEGPYEPMLFGEMLKAGLLSKDTMCSQSADGPFCSLKDLSKQLKLTFLDMPTSSPNVEEKDCFDRLAARYGLKGELERSSLHAFLEDKFFSGDAPTLLEALDDYQDRFVDKVKDKTAGGKSTKSSKKGKPASHKNNSEKATVKSQRSLSGNMAASAPTPP